MPSVLIFLCLLYKEHKEWLLSDKEYKFPNYQFSNKELMSQIHKELKGKVLGCWCAPLPCHGDTLAELAKVGLIHTTYLYDYYLYDYDYYDDFSLRTSWHVFD